MMDVHRAMEFTRLTVVQSVFGRGSWMRHAGICDADCWRPCEIVLQFHEVRSGSRGADCRGTPRMTQMRLVSPEAYLRRSSQDA